MGNVRQQVLVIRFSSLGDVAMTVPVLRLLLEQHPTLEILFLSNQQFAPLYSDIERLHFIGADLKGRHKGISGIFRLFRECKSLRSKFAVADLHNVLRSKLLCFLFRFSGHSVAQMDKGRAEKKWLTRTHEKNLQPLTSTFGRYAAVFRALGFGVDLPQYSSLNARSVSSNNPLRLGIAPFAQYREKTYPSSLMKKVIAQLQEEFQLSIFLYGAPGKEAAALAAWQQEVPGVINRAGLQSFQDELKEIASLDAMITMDSANMHLASLFGVPVVSVWGATHPFAGFMGWQQPLSNAVQVDLPCRPCSVFGNKPCFRGDWACMENIHPSMVVAKVKEVLFPAT